MSKIVRYQGDVRAFASDAQGMERTVFGGTNQADDLTSQITASFLRGWGIVGASEHPSLEDFNAAMYAMSQFIAYQHQMGVPEWHAEQEYHTGSICTHNGESYQSLQNANIGSQPPSAKWTPVLTSKNGLANLGLGASAFGVQNRVIISATGVTQWSVPDVLKKGRKCKVKVIGAGGSGGVGNAATAAGQSAIAGGGGGSGGISESLLDLTGIDSVTVTVGVGGTPVTSLSTNGVSGGTSSFGSYLSATGGIGGGQPSGGESGIGTGGDTNSSGGPGSPGGVLNADNNGVPSISGGSGGGPGGNGAAQLSAANKAADAKAPGGGGAGLKPSSGSGITSGRGGDGLVIIEW
ncbi:hypothetical protein ACRB72_000712 [Escherichia coli]